MPADEASHSGSEHALDLAERTASFGEQVIRFTRQIKLDAVTSPLVSQLVRSSTSIGANHDEADEATTRKDFRYRIAVCKKEAKETKRWFRMIVAALPHLAEEARPLWQEANELSRIFAAIYRSSGE